LLISDIEEETGRELIVFFCRLDQQITETDADDLAEILGGAEISEADGVAGRHVDLMIFTTGGSVDAVEKINAVLRSLCDYRVVIPSFAKSGGTLIALASRHILMGVNSELGPIDPQIGIPSLGFVPAQYVAEDQHQPETYRRIAGATFKRAQNLARKYLTTGMMKGRLAADVEQLVTKLSDSTGYGSHGAVIDYSEAVSLGLAATWLPPDSTLWKRIWLLHCLYDADSKRDNLGKIFEGAVYSLSREPLA
jgi:ClpP class serine protease